MLSEQFFILAEVATTTELITHATAHGSSNHEYAMYLFEVDHLNLAIH